MKKLHHAADFFKFAFVFEINKIDGKITNGYCNSLVDLLEKWILEKKILMS